MKKLKNSLIIINTIVFIYFILLSCYNPNSYLLDNSNTRSISDGGHSGNEHFFFLPPLVSNPVYNGIFDASLTPEVKINEFINNEYGIEIAVFTTTAGPGSETVRVIIEDEHYIVNWHTDEFNIDSSKIYRITILVNGIELGYADVIPVDNGKEMKNVDTKEYIPLIDGRTLPIKFRIEEGAVIQTFLKLYGGVGNETIDEESVRQTSDNGFIIAGNTTSSGAGNYDAIFIKLDYTGNLQWEKTFGGIGNERVTSVKQTLDEKYIIIGTTETFGAGNQDLFLIILNASGVIESKKTFGGSNLDNSVSVKKTLDGGYIVAGNTTSFGVGDYDIFLLKLDYLGNIEWKKTYGTNSLEEIQAIIQTQDEGFIIAGRTNHLGTDDALFVKIDQFGIIEWNKIYSGIGVDEISYVQQCENGEYIIVGFTTTPPGAGNYDFLLMKTNSEGNIEWKKAFGGNSIDSARFVQQTNNGDFIVGGITTSFGAGDYDSLILRFDSAGNILSKKTFGDIDYDPGQSIQQITGGGYILTGYTRSYNAANLDFFLLKMDSSLNIPGCSINFQNMSTGIETDPDLIEISDFNILIDEPTATFIEIIDGEETNPNITVISICEGN